MRRMPAFDMPLFLSFLILVGLGIAFIYTASYPKAMALSDTGGDSFYYTGRQTLFAVVGLLLMATCIAIPMRVYRKLSGFIAGFALFLLVLVLVIGTAKHGNKAWIDLGFFQFQPSEFAKVAIVLVLPAYLVRRPWKLKSWKGLFSGPFLLWLIPVGLIVLQEDLGSAFVVLLATAIFLGIAGVKFRYWGTVLGILVILAGSYIMVSSKAGRIAGWLDPENHAIKESYQPRNSLIAVGSGEVLGRGFCASRQKWFYLPAAHNDYILAIIAEELGFIQILLFLFAPYMFVIYRGFCIAHRAPDEYSALVAAGCTVMLATQALVNMAVVFNVMPSIGINLPFISYGGTSLIASMMTAGILLNVSKLRPKERPSRPVPATSVTQPAG